MTHALMIAACPFPSHQGSQVYVEGMARGLVEEGWSVSLATYGFGDPARPWPIGVARAAPSWSTTGSLRSGPSIGKLAHDARLAAEVVAAWRARPPDLVLAHHAEGLAVARAARAVVGGAAPLVYVLHTSLGEELPTYLPATLARGLGPTAAWLGDRADRRLARTADLAIAPSERGAALLRAWGAPGAVAVLPGVDPTELRRFDPAEVARDWGLDARPWVVYCGNTDRYQDLDVALDAMREVPEAGLLVVTGSEDGGLAEAIDARGLSGRAVVRVSRALDDTARALSVGRVAVLPRRRCAGFPIKLLNHLVLGVPTVAARGATAWRDGVVAVPDGDASAMASALRVLIADPAAAAALGAAGRDAVLARGTWAARTRALLDALRDVPRPG